MSATPAPGLQPRSTRVTRACDFCHRRGTRCKTAPGVGDGPDSPPKSCLTCLEYRRECTWNRQPKKRGTKPRGGSARQASNGHDPSPTTQPLSNAPSTKSIHSRTLISALLDVYLDSIHPIFPFFCERRIYVGWREGSFPADPGDQSSLMCMCALSAQHVGSGALFSDDVPMATSASLAQDYLNEATSLVSMEFDKPCINQIRSYGFLALLGAQTGNHGLAHKYLGLYHGICAQHNLHDESKWPASDDDCDREVRRRLWWLMYRLEVHTACVRGNIIRSPESQSRVGYPCGIHHPTFMPGRDGQFEDWFFGWNATTDLYRVLEHVIAEFRARRRPLSSVLNGVSIDERLSNIQRSILPQFESASSRSSDNGRNRCGFQASTILSTIYLARMISVSGSNDFRSACQTANDMIQSVRTIPIEYIRAAGSPLLQQLTGVGHMLAGVASKHDLSRQERDEFRAVLVEIKHFASLLSGSSSMAAMEEKRLASHLAEVERRPPPAAGNPARVEEKQSQPGEENEPNDYFEELVAEMEDDRHFFSTYLTDSLTWPYEPKAGE